MNKELSTSIAGERVKIRKLKPGDADEIYAQANNRAVSRWTLHIPYPYPKNGAISFIRRQQRMWKQGREFGFAIVLAETGRVVGVVGVGRIDHENKCGEVGYWIGQKYWGMGLASEAVMLSLLFGFSELGLYRMYASVIEPNVGSIRVLEKCGFTLEGVWRKGIYRYGKRRDFLQFGILRPEFRHRARRRGTPRSRKG